MSLSTGGCLCNDIIDLAVLDPNLPLTALCRIGNDESSDFVLEKLRPWKNINLDQVKRGGTTSFTLVMADEISKQRSFYQCRGANADFCESDIDWDALDVDILHIGYILLLDALDKQDKMDLNIQVAKLQMLRASHTSQIYRLETDIARTYPALITSVRQRIANQEADRAAAAPVLALDKEQFEMKVSGMVYTDRKDAGNALIKACTAAKTVSQELPVGEYHGFRLSVSYDTFANNFELSVRGQGKYTIKLGADPFGNLTRINNVLESFAGSLEESKRKLATLEQQLETSKEEVAKPFPQEQELIQKEARLSELNALLNMDERGSEAALIDEEATVDEEPQGRDAAEEKREDTVEADEPEQDEAEQPAPKSRRYQMAI